MQDPFELLVERQIQAAQEQGLFENLPGMGQPLPPGDDLSDVPAELRAAYAILAQANCLPRELELKRESLRLADLLAAIDPDSPEAAELTRRRSLAELQFELLMERRGASAALGGYRGQLRRRLGRSRS